MKEEINEIFNDWKGFLSWCYENNDKTIEIHRDDALKVMQYTKELQQRIKKANDFILSHAKEYKPHFAKVELNTADCNELLNILEGKDNE